MLKNYNEAFSLEQAGTGLIGTIAHSRHAFLIDGARGPVSWVCWLMFWDEMVLLEDKQHFHG